METLRELPMNNLIIVNIRIFNLNSFLVNSIKNNIHIERISYKKNILKCKIKKEDLNKINKYYKVTIVKAVNLESFLLVLKKNYLIVLSIFLSIFLFLLFKDIIIKVDIVSNNESLVKNLNKSLDNYGLHRLSIKKDENSLLAIKQKLEIDYKDTIEWLEIKNIGMTYLVTLEERKVKLEEPKESYCNVYAQKEGIVKKIVATQGNVLVSENQYVRAGDLLISGDISLHEDVKDQICALGTVYGEVWYKASISIPKKYQVKNYTGKTQTNFKLDLGRNDYKILRSKYQNYDEETKEIISILGRRLLKTKEKEYTYQDVYYTEEELEKKIDEVISTKINLQKEAGEEILYKNILKKMEFDSTIDIEVFVTALVILSK